MSGVIATLASAKGIFNPQSLFRGGVPGLILSLAPGTLFQEISSPVTPAINPGDPVGTVLDTSGNGNHATAPNTGARPTLGFNSGKPYLNMNGTSSYLTFAANPLAGATSAYCFSPRVLYADPPTGGGPVMGQWGTASSADLEPYSDETFYSDFGATTRGTFAAAGLGTSIRMIDYILQLIGANIWLTPFRNGVAIGGSAEVTVGWGSAPTIGKGLQSGSSFYFKGNIYPLIAISGTLSIDNLFGVRQWVTARCGLETINAIFVGDSLTFGVGSSGGNTYPAQTQALFNSTCMYIANTGISSTTAAQWVSSYFAADAAPLLTTRCKTVTFIWLGTNDLYADTSVSTTLNNLSTLWANARAKGKVVAFTILPRDNSGTPGDFETNRTALNTSIRAAASQYDALVDVAANSTIGSAGDEDNLTYYSGDGVHLNNTGYGIVAGLAQTALNGLL